MRGGGSEAKDSPSRQIATISVPSRPRLLRKAREMSLEQRIFWQDTLWAYLFLIPPIVLLGIFVFYPAIRSFILSLYDWNMISPVKTFVGLKNYWKLLHSPLFWKAFWNTCYYVFGSVPVTAALALALAVILNSKIKGKTLFRAAFFFSYITPTVAAAMIFRWIFNSQYGLANYLLGVVGLPPVKWLMDPKFSMPVVIFFAIWKFVGYQMLLFLAGLQNISQEVYEAAEVDGASAWQRFWYVTFPLISPYTFFVVLTSMMFAFRVFDEVYVMFPGGRGGPLNAAMTTMVFVYNEAFEKWHMGYASAAALCLFVVIILLTAVQWWLRKRWVFYE